MCSFRECLKVQRWDDHRYYHHSRINQSLHLVSATSFVCAYVTAFKDPAMAGLLGWLVSMTTRQVGHLFFEPKGYDVVNQATHEYKEAVKVGYNLRRKIVLLAIWALSPLLLWVDPTLLHTVRPARSFGEFAAACRLYVAGARRRGTGVPHGAAFLHPGFADRAGVGDEDPDRPVP